MRQLAQRMKKAEDGWRGTKKKKKKATADASLRLPSPGLDIDPE